MKKLSIFIAAMCAFIAVGFWFLPQHLRAPITHSAWFRSIATWFESDTRVIIADNSYPWRSIGIVHGNTVDPWMCTGFLIGPDLVATSRHCVVDDEGRLLRGIRYSVVRNTHFGMLPYEAIGIRTYPLDHNDAEGLSGDHPVFDLAVLQIATDVGDQVGFFGTLQDRSLQAGLRGSMEDEPDATAREYCGDTIRVLPWRDAEALPAHLQDLGLIWIAADPNRPPQVCAAGFSGDLGYANLSVAHACGLLALFEGLVIHNCAVFGGASGGPIFYLDRKGAPIAFATNTGSIDTGPLIEMFDLDEVSVGTLLTDLVRDQAARR